MCRFLPFFDRFLKKVKIFVEKVLRFFRFGNFVVPLCCQKTQIDFKHANTMTHEPLVTLVQQDHDLDVMIAEAGHAVVCKREESMLLELIYDHIEPTDGTKPTQAQLDAALATCDHCLPPGAVTRPIPKTEIHFVYDATYSRTDPDPIGVWCAESRLFYRGLSSAWFLIAQHVFNPENYLCANLKKWIQ